MSAEVGVCYNEKDFIDYLYKYICVRTPALIATLTNVYEENKLLKEHIGLQYFNF